SLLSPPLLSSPLFTPLSSSPPLLCFLSLRSSLLLSSPYPLSSIRTSAQLPFAPAHASLACVCVCVCVCLFSFALVRLNLLCLPERMCVWKQCVCVCMVCGICSFHRDSVCVCVCV